MIAAKTPSSKMVILRKTTKGKVDKSNRKRKKHGIYRLQRTVKSSRKKKCLKVARNGELRKNGQGKNCISCKIIIDD